MALAMLLALAACPAMLGSQEAIRQSQSNSRREEHRAQRCNLIATCVKPSIRSRDINNKSIVLKDSKLFINTGKTENHDTDQTGEADGAHTFNGYFLPYPDSDYEGLVSTISDEAPILNWIYVDKDTYEVKYGVRDQAQSNLTGPFDCTRQDRRMTFEGWEGFVAVEDCPGIWSLYFDRDDDGVKSKVPFGTRVLEVELTRREKRIGKAETEKPQNLEDMMKQHQQKEQHSDPEPVQTSRSSEIVRETETHADKEPLAADVAMSQGEPQNLSPVTSTIASDDAPMWDRLEDTIDLSVGHSEHESSQSRPSLNTHYKSPYIENWI